MAIIFLLLQWPALTNQDQVLFVQEQNLRQADLTNLRWQTIPGTPLCQYLGGFILEKNGLWLWTEGDLQQLPSPAVDQDYIPAHFESLSQPALLTLEHLWLWKDKKWLKFPSHNAAKCLPPGPPGSLFGLDVQPANWVWSDAHLIAFQESEEKAWIYDAGKQIEVNRKADLLFLLNGQATWLGWEKDERLKLARYQAGKETATSLNVPQLDKHALRFRTENGTWFFTFDDGMMAALDAWKTKKIEVKGHFIRKGNRFTTELGALPLEFEMGTSGSGSPKLLPHPAFRVFPVLNSDDICISLSDRSLWLGPGSLRQGPKLDLENAHRLVAFQKKIFWLGQDFIRTLKEMP